MENSVVGKEREKFGSRLGFILISEVVLLVLATFGVFPPS